MKQHTKQSGFALLLTIVIISVVLAIGLSLLDITVKQLVLSATARDSEVAFFAANAGIECGQKTRQEIQAMGPLPTASVPYECFEQTTNSQYSTEYSGRSQRHFTEFTWDINGVSVCTQVDLLILDASAGQYTHSFTGQGLADKTCENGNICTVVFSRGYNRACNDLSSLRVVQREITIDF